MTTTTANFATLNTTCIKSLQILENKLIEKNAVIKEWFQNQWQLSPAPIYGSVDLRNAGFKLAPIDMNLFPAGFNNLNKDYLSLSVDAAKRTILKIAPDTKKILIIPETHTRNLVYWSNIHTLKTILEAASFEIRFAWLNTTENNEPVVVDLPSGDTITLHALMRVNDHLEIKDFKPDFILLNNDLSEGIPGILTNLKQTIYPPAKLGWSERLKSEHFHYYAKVANEFSKAIDIDPWIISPLFKRCENIDFMQQEGMETLYQHAKELFTEIEKKYAEYHIHHQPFLIVKADAGTYGMAVMTVRHPDELKSLNRKQRTRMSKVKGGQMVDRVIIQEGVYTFETLQDAVAEPVVYLFGECVIGGFYRLHQDKGIDESLNSPGMRFEPLPFAKPCDQLSLQTQQTEAVNRYYTYGLVAKLSMLAAAREMKELSK